MRIAPGAVRFQINNSARFSDSREVHSWAEVRRIILPCPRFQQNESSISGSGRWELFILFEKTTERSTTIRLVTSNTKQQYQENSCWLNKVC